MMFNGYNKVRLGMAVLLCLCGTVMVRAKVKLPALISDGMVLQREQTIKVWGTADAGESIQVRFTKDTFPTSTTNKKLKDIYTATANADGQWSITLPSMKAGGPYSMLINDIEIRNILVGDVWLCSGQSNMELPISRVTDMFADEIAGYNNEKIRHIIIPKVYNFHAATRRYAANKLESTDTRQCDGFLRLGLFFRQSNV